MLNEPNFKPSNRLLNYWICLPQNSISVGHNKVPALFGKPRTFFFNYLFVIVLLLLEIYTIFTLVERGVSYQLMTVLVFLEFIIAIIPFLFEQRKLDFCSSYIDTKLFINKSRLKYTKADDPKNRQLQVTINEFEKKKSVIRLISYFVGFVIVIFCLIKFYTYYKIYRTTIFVNPAGRLVVATCILGLITHLTSTKVVLLDMLVRRRKRKEIQAKRDNVGDFVYGDTYNDSPIEINTLTKPPVFRRSEFNKQLLMESMNEAEYKKMSESEKGQVKVISTGDKIFLSTKQTFSKDAVICYTQLLKDKDLNDIIEAHTNTFEKEIIACQGKEIQLLQLTQ